MKRFALILAGGKGTRLWPLSRENFPKQFVEFKDGRSLFQLTVLRLLSVFAPKDVFIIAQESYKFTIYNQLDLLKGLKSAVKKAIKQNIILEPESRNTLPTITLAVKYLEEKNGLQSQDLVYVFPSDHTIEPVSKFAKSMKNAQTLAKRNKLVVFGVPPAYPKEGYGVEKPSLNAAKRLLNKGAFWNAGIFCFNKRTFLEELRQFQPQIHKYCALSYDTLVQRYKDVPKNSIDYGIMQKTKQAALVKFNLRWSDLGSWDSIMEYYTGKKANFNIGKAEFVDSSDCFTYSGKRLMCMVGLRERSRLALM